MSKKIFMFFMLFLVSTLIIGCNDKETDYKKTELVLNEAYYDSKSVTNGLLSGSVQSIIFETKDKGYIKYFKRSLASDGWSISHYRVEFDYTVIDEETIFITMGFDDTHFYEDDTTKTRFNTMKTEVLMISRDLILSNEGTHYIRESYLLDKGYIDNIDYDNHYFRTYHTYRGSVVNDNQFILKNIQDVNTYKSNFTIGNAMISIPTKYFVNDGIYIVLHIETPEKTRYEMSSYHYHQGELNIVLNKTTDTSLDAHSTYMFFMFHFFDTFKSVSYSIQ